MCAKTLNIDSQLERYKVKQISFLIVLLVILRYQIPYNRLGSNYIVIGICQPLSLKYLLLYLTTEYMKSRLTFQMNESLTYVTLIILFH